MYQQPTFKGARSDAHTIAAGWDVKVTQSSYGGLRYVVELKDVEFSEIHAALKDGGYILTDYDKTVESDGEGQYWEADFNASRKHAWLDQWVQCYGVCFSDENIWYLHFSNWDEEPRVRAGDAYMVRDLCVEECMLDLSCYDY